MRSPQITSASYGFATLSYPVIVIFTFSLIFVAQKMIQVDWLDMLHGTTHETPARFVDNGWIAYICVVTVLSIFGGIPVLEALDNKNSPGRLAFHLFNVTAMLTVSIYFVVMAFRLTSLVGTWRQSDFPKQIYDTELTVARKFNTRFCETQSSYFCDRATLNELLAVNFGRVMMTNKSAASVQTKEVADLCLERYGLNISEEAPSWGYICAYCVGSETIESNEGFFNWTTDNCRPNTKTLSWCTTSLNATDVASVITGSPFDVCRVPFLEHMHYWSRTFGVLIIGNVLCLLVVLVCTLTWFKMPCQIRRHNNPQHSAEDVETLELEDSVLPALPNIKPPPRVASKGTPPSVFFNFDFEHSTFAQLACMRLVSLRS